MRKKWEKGLVVMLAAILMLPSGWGTGMKEVKASEQTEITPDYEWDFESDVSDVLKGTAKVEAADITIGNTAYSGQDNHVLTLGGGSKGSSYMELPSELYQGVDSQTGFSYSFWMKTDSSVVSYSRLISSANSSGGDEFAYAPYASDKVWNVVFDTSNAYRVIYADEPQKNVWNYITFTVSKEEITLYVNGVEVSSTIKAGVTDELTARLDGMEDLVINAVGKTCSGWSDPDCKAQIDDLRFYKKVLSAEDVVQIANDDYGFTAEVKEETVSGGELEYTDGTQLTQVQLKEENDEAVTSPDGKTELKILTDTNKKSYYYSSGQNGENVLQASALGIVTASCNYTKNVEIDNISISEIKREEYDLPAGRSSHVKESYRELSFDLLSENGDSDNKCTVQFRIYNDGIAFRYEVFGSDKTSETIRSEASEYVLPYNGTKLWLGGTSNTYEVDYNSTTMKSLTNKEGNYTIPALASTGNGKEWVLLTEANVFNEETPYCSSYLTNAKGERNLKVKFGNKVGTVQMPYENGSFHTPWRVAVITDDMNQLVNSNLVTNLNPQADEDTYHYSEWVQSFKADWSWWSESGDDPIEYAPQKDYIDFAAENGWDAVCLDFGWCLWEDYKEKVKELCDYAAKKNVKIMLWYGVNNTNHAGNKDAEGKAAYPTYSLRTTEQLEQQFEWAHSTGVYAVKVDYYESDTQETMKQMQECAKIAAENQLCVLFHGCTMPGGENRTYPNILSYEAVYGEEYHKFGLGSPTMTTLLTYPYTRNVVGSMDFTPAALPVTSISATAGFQLAETVVFESGTLNLASSIYAYEGNPALGFLNQVESSFEESVLVDTEQAEPGDYVAIARKSKKSDKWFVGAMTKNKTTTEIALDFLGDGVYNAVIYRDNDEGSAVVCETKEVTKDTVIREELKAAVESDGVYEMSLYYKAGTNSQIAYRINGAKAIKTGLICSGTNSIAKYTCFVELKKGENSIVCYNPNANFIGLDRVAIGTEPSGSMTATLSDETDYGLAVDEDATKYSYTEYKAIDGETNAVKEPEGYVGWLGENASSYLTIYVNVEKAGTYKMRIGYMTGAARSFYLSVNHQTAVKMDGPSTGGYKMDSLGYLFSEVKLNAGENSLTFTNPSAACPNIYSVGISTQSVEEMTAQQESKKEDSSGQSQNTVADNPEKSASETTDTGSTGTTSQSQSKTTTTVGKVKNLKVSSKKKGQMTVSWKKLKGISGYQIQYGKKKNLKNSKKVTVKKSKNTWTKKKLKSGKQFYVRIRAYKVVSGKKKYGKWTGKKKIKIR